MKLLKKLLIAAAIPVMITTCAFAEGTTETNDFVLADHLTCNWEITNKEYDNFTDLGNYMIRLGDFTEFDMGKIINIMRNYSGLACTCVAKIADNGDMLVGRNMDIDARQFPTFISTTSFGRYRTVNISYMFSGPYTYRDILAAGKIDENYLKAIPFSSTDVFNEKGLYIETNMRSAESSICFESTNPGKERAPWTIFPALACANCATVDEAVQFAKDAYDFYISSLEGSEMSGWNFAFMLADATGKYGLLESANGEILFTPYAYGQSNYYVSPRLNGLNTYGCGYGRLELVNRYLFEPQTKEEMLDLVSKIYFSKEVIYPEYSYRDEAGELHFVDDQGNEICDWRSDYSTGVYIDDDGVAHAEPTNPEEAELQKNRATTAWCLDDANFENLQAAVVEKNKQNVADLKEFFNGNEDPLRDNGQVWTSSISLGVNCTERCFILKMWERDDVKLEFAW